MKQKDLIELGFKKVKVSAKESGDSAYYYYTWDPYKGSHWSLITNCSDEIIGDNWSVYSFEDDRISFRTKTDLKLFVNVIKRCIK